MNNKTLIIAVSVLAILGLTIGVVAAARRKSDNSDTLEVVDNMPKSTDSGAELLEKVQKTKQNSNEISVPSTPNNTNSRVKPESNTVNIASDWQPFGWIGAQTISGASSSGLYIPNGNNGMFKVNDIVEVLVQEGDTSYNGFHRIVKLGTDDDVKYPEYINKMITINTAKKGAASGKVRQTNIQFSGTDLSQLFNNPNPSNTPTFTVSADGVNYKN